MNAKLESLESRRLMDAGELDASFGDVGFFEFTRGESVQVRSFDLDVAPQEGFVVAAVLAPDDDSGGMTIEVQRLLHDGTPWTRFAGDGVMEIAVPADRGGSGNPGSVIGPHVNVEVTPDGSILVHMGYRLWKLRPNGSLDRNFAHSGRAAFIEFEEGRMQVDVDPQGLIYVAGVTAPITDPTSTVRLHVLTPDGSLVRTVGGAAGTPIGGALARPNQFGLRAFTDGSVLLTATRTLQAGEAYTAVRLRPDGTVDPTYGSAGVAAGSVEGASDDGIIDDVSLHTAGTGEVFIHHARGDQENPAVNENFVHKFDPSGTFVENVVTEPDALGFPTLFVRDDALFLVSALGTGLSFLDAAGAGIDDATANAAAALEEPGVATAGVHLARDGTILVVQERQGDNITGVGNAFRVARMFRDVNPVGQLLAKNVGFRREGSYRFTVQYRDDDGIDLTTLGDDDVTVGFPDGTRRRARLVDADATGTPNVVNVTYLVTSPDGVWDGDDNGTYTVRLQRRSIRDVNGNAAAQRQIGIFWVALPLAVVAVIPSPLPVVPDDDQFDDLVGPPAIPLPS